MMPVRLAQALDAVVARLLDDQQVLARSLANASDGATSEESRAENKYDTRATEASYLAAGQSRRAEQLRATIGRFRQIPREGGAAVVRGPCLVTLAGSAGESHYLLGPGAGGLAVEVDGVTVRVLTAESPLGRTLVGACEGDEVAGPGGQALTVVRVD
jgi:hypothetical protein